MEASHISRIADRPSPRASESEGPSRRAARGRPRSHRLSLCLGGWLLAACQAGGIDQPSAEECDGLVDHVVDLQFAGSAGVDAARAGSLAEHRQIVKQAVGPEMVAACATWSPGRLECAMAAGTQADLVGCGEEGDR